MTSTTHRRVVPSAVFLTIVPTNACRGACHPGTARVFGGGGIARIAWRWSRSCAVVVFDNVAAVVVVVVKFRRRVHGRAREQRAPKSLRRVDDDARRGLLKQLIAPHHRFIVGRCRKRRWWRREARLEADRAGTHPLGARRLIFETNVLKGMHFQGVETMRFQRGVNLMCSTCTTPPSSLRRVARRARRIPRACPSPA